MNRKFEIVSEPVPEFLKPEPAKASPLLIIDERLPLARLLKVFATNGYTVINDQTGKLVVTSQEWIEDFKA